MEVTCRFDFSSIAIEREHTVTLMVRIIAPPPPKKLERKPLNLALVLDRSGSMEGEKIRYAKLAAQGLIGQLASTDRISVVIFDHEIETIVQPRQAADKARIRALIDRIVARGNTNLSGGWLEGLARVESGFSPEGLNRALLLTDGLANGGVTAPEMLREVASAFRKKGITTTTLGFGADFDEKLLQALADEGGGGFYFIENPDDAPAAFAQELGDLMAVVGQNLTIELRGRPPARFISVLNEFPVEPIEDGLRIRAGDIFGDERREVLAEVLVPGRGELGPCRVADVTVELDQVVEPVGRHRLELPVEINVVPAERAPAAPDPEVEIPAELLRVNEVRRRAIDLIERGDTEGAQRVVREAIAGLEARGLLTGDLRLEIDRLREELERTLARPEFGTKPLHYAAYHGSHGKGSHRMYSVPLPEVPAVPLEASVVLLPTSDLAKKTVFLVGRRLYAPMAALGIDLGVNMDWTEDAPDAARRSPLGRSDEEALAAEAKARFPGRGIRIIVIDGSLEDGRPTRWHRPAGSAVLALGGWAAISKLSPAAFLAGEIVLQGLRGAGRKYDPEGLLHAEARGCLFDLCEESREIEGKLTSGGICPACRAALASRGASVEEVLELLSVVRSLAAKKTI